MIPETDLTLLRRVGRGEDAEELLHPFGDEGRLAAVR